MKGRWRFLKLHANFCVHMHICVLERGFLALSGLRRLRDKKNSQVACLTFFLPLFVCSQQLSLSCQLPIYDFLDELFFLFSDQAGLSQGTLELVLCRWWWWWRQVDGKSAGSVAGSDRWGGCEEVGQVDDASLTHLGREMGRPSSPLIARPPLD